MRRLLVALGVAAVGIGATACTSSGTTRTTTTTATTSTPASTSIPTTTMLPAGAALRGNRAAIADIQAALRHGEAMSSVHYVSTSTQGELTTTIVGDVDQTSGTQTVVVSYKGSRSQMMIELIGHEAYFRGAAIDIGLLIDLPPRAAAAAAAAGLWISVVPADKSFWTNTAAALTVGSAISEMTLSSPIAAAHTVQAKHRPALQISGAWTGEQVPANDDATAELELTKGPGSLPIRFSGVMETTGVRFTETLVVSKWGERVHVAAPRDSVPLPTILKSTTTTTQPVVV